MKVESFKEWLIRRQYPEMVGTGAVYDGTKSPDFNWWGAPESAIKPGKKKKKHKKHNESFGDAFSRAQWAYDNQTPYDDEADCPACGGEGVVECEDCQKGKVACECGGKDQNCEYCGGSGFMACEECNGKGEKECRECEGSGVVSRSHAKGYYDDRRDWDDDDRY